MKPNTIETCICLLYIGDNGPCPVHGDPHNPVRSYIPRRLKQLKQALSYRRATSTMRLDRRDDGLEKLEDAKRLAKAVRD